MKNDPENRGRLLHHLSTEEGRAANTRMRLLLAMLFESSGVPYHDPEVAAALLTMGEWELAKHLGPGYEMLRDAAIKYGRVALQQAETEHQRRINAGNN